MSSTTCIKKQSLDISHKTKASASWPKDNSTQFLIKPDPKTSTITVTTRFNTEAALFELLVPIKLKGLDTVTNAIIRVCASSIVSLDIAKSPTVPTAIGKTFESTAVCRLDFMLKYPPTLIVHNDADEPLRASKKSSGPVLAAIRDLYNSTTLSIYIEDREASSDLQHISHNVGKGVFTVCSARYCIATLYGGKKGKVIDPSRDTSVPPSYDETTPCLLTLPPPIEFSSNKRRRKDTETEVDNISLLWTEIRAIKQRQSLVDMDKTPSRLEALETENMKLKLQNKELVERIEKLQERYDALENTVAALVSNYEDLDETVDCSLSELQQETERLQETVEGIQKAVDDIGEDQVCDKSLEEIQKAVVDDIVARLMGG